MVENSYKENTRRINMMEEKNRNSYAGFDLYDHRQDAFGDLFKTLTQHHPAGSSIVETGTAISSVVETGTGDRGEAAMVICAMLSAASELKNSKKNYEYISYELSEECFRKSENLLKKRFGQFPKLHHGDMFSYFEDYPNHVSDLYFLDAGDEHAALQYLDENWLIPFLRDLPETDISRDLISEVLLGKAPVNELLQAWALKVSPEVADSIENVQENILLYPKILSYYQSHLWPGTDLAQLVGVKKVGPSWLGTVVGHHEQSYKRGGLINLEFFLRIEKERSKKGTLVLLDDALFGRGGPILYYLLYDRGFEKWDAVWGAKGNEDCPTWSNLLLKRK